MKTMFALPLIFALAGCSAMSPSSSPLAGSTEQRTQETYQLGDVTNDVSERFLDRQAEYCATTNPYLRAALLSLIRSRVPGYPPSGLCTDTEQAVAEEVARQLKTAEGIVDIEQARRDQARFQPTEEN